MERIIRDRLLTASEAIKYARIRALIAAEREQINARIRAARRRDSNAEPPKSTPQESQQMRFLLLTALALSTATAAKGADMTATDQLHSLLDREWQWYLRENPTTASFLGYSEYDNRWPDVSMDAYRRRHEHRERVLEELSAIDADSLSPSDRLNLVLFRKEYERDVEGYPYRWHLVPLTGRDGIQDENSLGDALSFETARDFENWITRLQKFPRYMDQTLSLMEEGVRAGIVQPKVVMERVPGQIRRQIVDDPEKSLFYKPFRQMPDAISRQEQERLRSEARRAIEEQVVPAYKKMLAFFDETYLPACFDRVGVWQIPNGQEFYAFRARSYTTTDLTPREIHELGLREVKRIRGEMEEIVEEVGFDGTFQEFLEHLRSDPQFYYKTGNELLAAYQAIGRKIDPQLPRLFKRLPRVPYDVQSIPMNMAPDTTTAYYRPPAADGSRAGTYFVNLYKPEVRPKYEMEALSLHEAVPGHHLQIALAMEQENLPPFRRYGDGYTVFVEGWALYAERLGDELGLYQDPYSRFGQLTYEMWRAIRLVVDPGMHSLKWSRQQAIDFFKENSAKTEHDIVNEIDRYIAWPGQALAYKIGELKILELRRQAEEKLGERFDVREFHDVVLRNGAVPLDVLEAEVEAWLEEAGER